MKCKECGYENSREGQFCAHCGAPLGNPDNNDPTGDESTLPEELEQEPEQEPEGDAVNSEDELVEGSEETFDQEPDGDSQGVEDEPDIEDEPVEGQEEAPDQEPEGNDVESAGDPEEELLVESTYNEAAPAIDSSELPGRDVVELPAEQPAETPVESEGSPEFLGPFELRGELGRGAMARVWRGFDTRLKRDVAIKEPLFDPRLSDEVLEEMGRRFVKEGEMAARLNHTNIVTIYEANVYDGNRPAIVMELVEGTTLSHLIEDGVLDSATKVDVLDQLLDGVGYAHSKGVVHRDIKPDNVFVSSEGVVKLADFGIARVDDASATHATVAGAVLGTPGYMSPEQIRGASVDNRSDLFSIGVIAYEMFAGKNPFGADAGAEVTTIVYRVVNEQPEGIPSSASAGLPVDVRPAIMAALAKDPNDRPQTAAEFKGMLHGGVAVPSVSQNNNLGQAVAASSQRSGIPKWLPYALVALVGVVITVVIVINATSGAGGSYAANGAPTAGGASGSQTQTAAGESSSAAQTATSEADAKAKAEAEKKKAEEDKKKAQAQNPPVFTMADASSVLPPSFGLTYGAELVLDNNNETAWNEGSAGSGEGEWIMISAGSPQLVSGINIRNGYSSTRHPDYYDYNPRPASVTIELSDGYKKDASLDDVFNTWQTVSFDTSHVTTYVKVTITSTVPGNKYNDAAISDIQAF